MLRREFVLSAALPLALEAASTSPAKAVGLRCEYVENPLGIDERRPRLSWRMADVRRGARQSAYRITVSSTPRGEADLWDTGRVTSAETIGIEYSGKPLRSRQRCYWRVILWDHQGVASSWSELAWWEMGLLSAADWQAKWIATPPDATRSAGFRDWHRSIPWNDEPAPSRVPAGSELDDWIAATKSPSTEGLDWSFERLAELQPAPMFRREFELAAAPQRATLYICGLGCFELRINGNKVGDGYLEPAESDYDVRAFYRTYEVSQWLRPGKNAIGVMLGDGWFTQTVGFSAPGRKCSFGNPGLILQLEVNDARVLSGADWKCTLQGPLRKNAIFGGEVYDARLAMSGWDRPGFDDSTWLPAVVTPPLTPKLGAQAIPPVRVIERLQSAAPVSPQPGVWVYDFGKLSTGYARLRINAPAGTALTLKFAETLDHDGTAYQPPSLNIGAKGTDMYICGGGHEEWEPRFTYHSFRYVQIEGYPGKPPRDLLEGLFLSTSMRPAICFECSDPTFNKLHAAFVRTGLTNAIHKWTDCPSREKTGWLSYPSYLVLNNFEAQPFFAKLISDAETKTRTFRVDGRVFADVSRGIILGRRGSWLTEQVVSTILLPWELYLHYGDRRILERHDPYMQATMRYFTATAPEGILETEVGDWHDALPLEEFEALRHQGAGFATLEQTHSIGARVKAAQRDGRRGGGGYAIHTHPFIVSTAHYHYAARVMSDTARLLHRESDANEYAELAARIKNAFVRRFYHADTATFGSQTADALALWQDLVPEGARAVVLKSLVRDIETQGGHFTTGQLGTDRLLEVLADHDRDDVAYRLIHTQGYPSFALMLASGATTTWETWGEAILTQTPAGSPVPVAAGRPASHIEFTGVDAWFWQRVAGIQYSPDGPGFQRFILRPHLLRQLQYAKASLESVRGRIESEWRREGSRVRWNVQVPPNTTARAYVPTKNSQAPNELELDAGTHQLSFQLD